MTLKLLPAVSEVEAQSVAVIICAYTQERWDDVLAAIESSLNQIEQPDELIVVVDHNPELLTRLEAQFHCRPMVQIVANSEAKGLSGGRNTGVARASAEIIAFLDDDAVAEPTWLTNITGLYANPSVLGVGGAAEPAWDQGRPRWFPREFDWVVGCTYKGMPDHTAPVRNMIGSNMSFRRSVVLSAGGFDPELGRCDSSTLPQGAEETELCIRAANQNDGGFFVFTPDAQVHHRVRGERTTLKYFTRRCWAEGLSKAAASRKVGGAALSSERAHVVRALPRGVVEGVGDSLRRGTSDGLRRAAAIVIGLAATVGGFAQGHLNSSVRQRRRD